MIYVFNLHNIISYPEPMLWPVAKMCRLSPSRKTCGLGPSQDFQISSMAGTLLGISAEYRPMAHPQAKLTDVIRRPVATASSFHRSAANHLQQTVSLAQRNGISRRRLLTLLASTAAIPDGSESRKALLQEYLNKSKENKEKNDKERLDDYYKRNYKDYFGLIEGPAREKKEEERTESEKRILEWLDKNK
ncbi:hypothetical protein BS78_01G093300 [Paspalum vaginatum]|nr:hypothetical protein BS78_01G093300 [Paspalum vaginatum]